LNVGKFDSLLVRLFHWSVCGRLIFTVRCCNAEPLKPDNTVPQT
jgi:hypothetical protein